RFVRESQLDGFVPISFDGADLQHVARTGLNDRHRNDLPSIVEELRHPDLAAEYTNCHRSVPVVSCRTGARGSAPTYPFDFQSSCNLESQTLQISDFGLWISDCF